MLLEALALVTLEQILSVLVASDEWSFEISSGSSSPASLLILVLALLQIKRVQDKDALANFPPTIPFQFLVMLILRFSPPLSQRYGSANFVPSKDEVCRS
jgi:hypothetical protein